jgi:hypothetical protein
MIGTMIATGVAVATAVAQPPAQVPPPAVRTFVGLGRMNTQLGPTGLVVVPTAQVVSPNELTIGMTFSDADRGPSVNYGITQGLEVGVAYSDVDARTGRLLANAKLNIVPANIQNVQLGIGVMDAFNVLELDPTFYVVASAFLTPPMEAYAFRVHAGFGTGMFRNNAIFGAEAILANRWAVVADYDSRNINAALQYAHDENFRAQAGFQHTNFFITTTYSLRF